ncbi:GNAT family N-acetyltransferase [Lactococcus protaetiae]|uniref:GNAT family N-acetyltransferase n=1 Tax=Lactococcus protaetiae TaxID=2592653 RepID=A0A514Z7M2_9LACT|nr:GNAT family N-acetyltransferase [Lactococcus protaetiae]QDK70497.1 GNAT family N-acetyltransferase [Lactococcus protaetiae]
MIRKAEMKDVVDITRLSAVLGYPVSESVIEQNLARLLLDDTHEFWVYDLEDTVVGFIEAETYEAVYSADIMLNVLGLVVDTAYQGKAIGGQLLTELELRAKARGISVIRLNSGEQRHEAHRFYEKHGYRSNHSQKRFLKFL